MSVNQKLLQYAEHKGISQRKFTASLGLSEGVLRRGKNIGSGYLIRIREKYPDLNMDWLLFDEGGMIKKEGVGDSVRDQVQNDCMERLVETQNQLIKVQDQLLKANKTIHEFSEKKLVSKESNGG